MSKVFTITEGLENMGAIKTGGQGSVYKGRRVGEIITAIKLLPTPILSQSEDDKHYRDFSNEVKKLQRVNEVPNPNIVKILSYGVSETGCFPFIEMEYIDGPDLGELLKPPYPPVFTIKEVIKVAEHLSNALAQCHSLDVKHGDIKSNNVKYNRNTGNYVLLDFGLAVLSDEERRTSLRHAGAIEFMAPEQNEGMMLFETDVYSFGIVLFELLAGKVPFPLDGNSETARNKVMVAHMETPPPDLLSMRAEMLPSDWTDAEKKLEMQVPDWLVSLVYRCLEKKPENRFENGVALHNQISHHRIYTAELVGFMQNEDAKWNKLLAEKTYEVQDLKALLARQDRELESLRQQNRKPVAAAVNTVSRTAYTTVWLALLMVGALAVYGLFFRHTVAGASRSQSEKFEVKDSRSAKNDDDKIVRVNQKQPEKRPEKNKPTTAVVTDTAARKLRPQSAPEKMASDEKDSVSQDNSSATDSKATADSSAKVEKAATFTASRYKVRDRAYFHNQPSADSKRDAFVTHWDPPVKALGEKNGYIYIEFTNEDGQTSRGWLSKDDLIPVK